MTSSGNIGPLINSGAQLSNILLPYEGQLKFAHMNCQSIKPSENSTRFDELKLLLIGSHVDVFAVSETWLKPYITNRSVKIQGYTFCRNDRPNSRGGGVGLYIADGLKYRILFKTCVVGSCESLFLEISCSGIKILFGVVYLPYGDINTFEQEHIQLLSSYSNIIIAGDFNYNLLDISKSIAFRSLCTRLCLSIVHNCRPTHFDISHGSTSLIDFILISDRSLITFTDQYQYPALSRHALICACLRLKTTEMIKYLECRNYKGIDLNGMMSFLSNFDSSLFYSTIDVDILCDIVCSLLHSLLAFVPVIRKKIIFGDDDWMGSRDILLARSLRDLAFLAFKRERSSTNWRIYCKYRNRAKRTIRSKKRQYFSNLFNRLDNVGIWRVLKNSGCLDNDLESYNFDVDAINSFFVDTCSTFANDLEDIDGLHFSEESTSFRCVNESEIFEALNEIKSNSVGTDGIPIKFIKIVFPYVSSFLLHLFNSILMTSKFPAGWKTARVVPIPKSKVVNGPEDLRPISILPALSKVMEHILKVQILGAISSKIYHSQYAFRPGYNTTTLLLDLTDSVRNDINENKLSVLVSLDLSKAFNSLNYRRIFDKLRVGFGFSLSACKLILSFLSERSQFVALNGINSSLLNIHSGVPQGSVLGPLLFILYINDLPDVIDTTICKTYIFADDVALLFSCDRNSPDILQSEIEHCLSIVCEWTTRNCMLINASKTKGIVFNPFERFHVDLNISINGIRIDFMSQIKFLGILLDCKLNFGPQIDVIISRILMTLRRLHSINAFYPSCIRYKLAHALLMSQILYGLEVISGTVSSNISRLNRIVNTVVRFVYRVGRREHVSGFVRQFLGCSFSDFLDFRALILFHRVIKFGKPSQLCDRFSFSHSTRNPNIIIPRIRNSFYERSFLVRIARCWNRLPIELRTFSHSNNAFRLKLANCISNISV